MAQFDSILVEIGECGAYQIILLIFLSFVKFFAAFQTLSPVFTAAHVAFWCSGLNSTTVSNASSLDINDCSLWFNDTGESCQSWTFSSSGTFKSTWRSQFGLVCSREKLVNICSTIFMLGLLIGSTAYGILSDRHGRVVALCTAVLNTWTCGMALAFSPSVEFYAVLRFLCGLGASGIFTVCNALVAESVTSKYRLMWVLLGTNGWNVAMCVLSIIAYCIRSHWKLELVLASPAVLVLPFIILLGESPRWLLAKNRPQRAYRRCLAIARINRKSVPPKFQEDVKHVSDTLIAQQGQQPHPSLLDLLKSKTMRLPTLLVWNNFFSGSLVFYGLLLSTGKLQGNIFLNFLLSSAVGIPSSIFAIVIGRLIGRPLLFAFEFSASATCMLVIAFLMHHRSFATAVTVLAIAGRFFIAGGFDGSWAYASELFPTLVRNTGMGSASTAARVGGILAPIINMMGEWWQPLPFLIFAITNFITAFLVLLLPETKGAKLPETLEDADEEYTKPKLMRMLAKVRTRV